MSEPEKSATNEPKFVRSPSFPILPIDEAIDRVGAIYREDRRAFTPYEAVISHMGYASTKKKGGRSARAVSTLKQYDLLDERDGQYRVSDTAFKILELPIDSLERTQLIKQCALSPPLLRKVFQYYNGDLPSDTAIRSYLIFQEKFNPDSVADFIRILRRTKEIVNPQPQDYAGGNFLDEEQQPSGSKEQAQQPSIEQNSSDFLNQFEAWGFGQSQNKQAHINDAQQANKNISKTLFKYSVPLSVQRNVDAHLIITGTELKRRDLNVLAKKVQNLIDAFEEESGQVRRKATWHNKEFDIPVFVISEPERTEDGREYVAIEGSKTRIPFDEVEFEDEE